MGLHRAETCIAASPQQVWDTVTSPDFSIWPEELSITFDSQGELSAGTEVYTRISDHGISGLVVSRIVECHPPYRLTTELVRTTGLPVAPDSAHTLIEGREEDGLTIVALEIDLKFGGLKRLLGIAADLRLSQKLQPGLDQMKANFEKVHKT